VQMSDPDLVKRTRIRQHCSREDNNVLLKENILVVILDYLIRCLPYDSARIKAVETPGFKD
jgi:hypothetical protein